VAGFQTFGRGRISAFANTRQTPVSEQTPRALLERVIKASSNENDIVLDAFCGWGTAVVAAQNLKRQWIGIDISPTACRVTAKEIRDKGFFVSFDFSRDALTEIDAFFRKSDRIILPLTVKEILNEEIARTLA
jgi:methylase of polypeptide subunit release factors